MSVDTELLPKKHMSAEEVASIVKAAFSDIIIEDEIRDELVVEVDRKDIFSFAASLKSSPELKMNFLRCLLGVDGGETLEVVYLPYSLETGAKITIRVPLSKEDAIIPSLFDVWAGCDWHERETAELFGITFEGHPDPRNLLLPDDFEGYPLRKEFELEDEEEEESPEPINDEEDIRKIRQASEAALKEGLEALAKSPDGIFAQGINEKGYEIVPGANDKTIWINMGPQHPSTHGVFRMQLQLDAERIINCVPHLGYLHRGWEKLVEDRTYTQIIPLTDRLHYINSIQNELVYCMAIESLLEIEVPKRAQYIRVLLCELQRISNHLIAFASFGMDMGALTPFFYGLRDREWFIDLLEMITGARLTTNFIRVGGIKEDIPDGFIEEALRIVEIFPPKIDEYEQLITGNEIVAMRNKNVGVLHREDAIDLAVSGPVLRACGVKFDLRKSEPYSSYEDFDFEIPTGENGDAFDRYKVRIEEMRQSNKIIEQVAERLPEGDIKGEVPRTLKPEGEIYTRIESSLGELGLYLVADGSPMPSRIKIRPPSYVHLRALPEMLEGALIGDVIMTLSTIDLCMGEVDR